MCSVLPVGPTHPLSIRRTSETPFTLSCDSTHLPPYLVGWWQNDSVVSDRHTHSLLTDRHTSSYENILVVAAGNRLAGTTYTCGVGTQVQPYSGGQAEPPATTTCELSSLSVYPSFFKSWNQKCSFFSIKWCLKFSPSRPVLCIGAGGRGTLETHLLSPRLHSNHRHGAHLGDGRGVRGRPVLCRQC